jgi:hypothetical protein
MVKVLRILLAALLLVVVAAGCGGADRPQRAVVPRVPSALAQNWEGQASDIAAAASAGNSCRAQQLANVLRADVVASKDRVPSRLQPPLLTSVNALAERIKCVPVVQTSPTEPTLPTKPTPPKEPKPKEPHEHHHDHHGQGGKD